MPYVSVVIPTYNSARYLPKTIDSVLNQTFRDFEVIVVDDGSKDDTAEIISTSYLDKVIFIQQPNLERCVARNNAIRHSSGEIIAFLDLDDIWLPSKLEKQIAILQNNPEVVLCYTQASYIDQEDQPIRFCGNWIEGHSAGQVEIKDLSQILLKDNVIYGGGSSAIVRKNIIDRAGWFDETITHCEDWDLWSRVSRYGLCAYIPEPLVAYRVFGWEKLLERQSSADALKDGLWVVEKALSTYPTDQRTKLEKEARREVTILALLGNYQLKRFDLAKTMLKKAAEFDPWFDTREGLMEMALGRAKTIAVDSGSYEPALEFISNFYTNLPDMLEHHRQEMWKAMGGLYVSAAFEHYTLGEYPAARKLWLKGIRLAPDYILNRGVLSIAVHIFLGNRVAELFRKMTKSLRKSSNAKS